MLTSHVHNCFDWLMSDKVLSSLPKDLQDLVLKSAKEASAYGDKLTMEQEEDYKKKLAEKGMKVVQVDLKAFMAKTQPAVEKIRPKWAKGVYEEVQKLTAVK
jgi:TRAP-type C4-dicarboxylate transport system substrate-binding protein